MEEKISNIESLAMIARVPRRLVTRYGEVHRQASENVSEGDYGGFVTTNECQEEIRFATESLVTYLWHPWQYHLRLRHHRLRN